MSSLLVMKSIFGNALALPAADRAAYLDTACNGDAALRAELEKMLEAHAQAGSFLRFGLAGAKDTPLPISFDNPATQSWVSLSLAEPMSPLCAGTVLVNRYHLVEQIGEGGMGSVWLANQTEPVRRQVAVKLVKDGMDTRQVLARFDAERQALALMDHPNIAKVLDAGSTSDGRPFFVMELVEGIPITKFCDREKATPQERLALFVPVCQAIQHAHQKGIIHRDIKPSNVLVALYDGKPIPKVIDFGVAKATGPMLTEMTLHTGLGLIGTPEYMAPEQVELNRVDVDTRADVYGLGALLYELLTGTPPISRRELRGAGLLEVLQAVRQQEPPKPSTRLSGSATLVDIAAHRGMESQKLTRLIRGDLDWIVMRTLEKDRNRRYETANGLARDIERYLAGETVQAAPPSTWYRTRKFMRRNRGPVVAAMLLLFALTVGIAGTTIGLFRTNAALDELQAQQVATIEQSIKTEKALKVAEEERSKTKQALDAITQERNKTENERVRANDEREIAEAVTDFLREDLLGQSHMGFGSQSVLFPESTVTLRTLLDRASQKVGLKFKDRPRIEAAIRRAIGEGYNGIYAPQEAFTQFQQAKDLLQLQGETNSPEYLAILRGMAYAYATNGRTDEGIKLLKQILATHELAHPNTPDHPSILEACYDLARFYPITSVYRTETLNLLKRIWLARKKTLGPGDPATVRAEFDLVWTEGDRNRIENMIPALERLVAAGTGNTQTDLEDVWKLATTYRWTGRFQTALPLFQRYREGCIKLSGPKSWVAAQAARGLVLVYYDLHRNADAVEVLEDYWAIKVALYGPYSMDAAMAARDLACGYHAVGRTNDAIRLLEENLPAVRWAYGNYDNAVFNYLGILVEYHQKVRQVETANTTRDEMLAFLLEPDPVHGRHRDDSLARAGLRGAGTGELPGAEAAIRDWLNRCRATTPKHWTTFSAETLLGIALLKQGKNKQAEQLLLSGHKGLESLGSNLPTIGQIRLSEATDRLIELYTAWGKPDQVAVWQTVRSAYSPRQAPAPRRVLK